MLHLKLPTDPRWADLAGKSLEYILTDHAYCEQKAATTCISLIVQYPDRKEIVEELAPIVSEEWGHFRRVLHEMNKRGYSLGKQRKDEYVVALNSFVIAGGSVNQRLVDKLLICALIEARSCERFKLLHQSLEEVELRQFYYDFMVSEARHYTVFIELARGILERAYVDNRWESLLAFEVDVLKTIGIRADRMH